MRSLLFALAVALAGFSDVSAKATSNARNAAVINRQSIVLPAG